MERNRTLTDSFFIRRTFIGFGIGNQHRQLDVKDIQLPIKILAGGKQGRCLRCRHLCKTEAADISAERKRLRLQCGIRGLHFGKCIENSRHQLGFRRYGCNFFEAAGGLSFFSPRKRCNAAGKVIAGKSTRKKSACRLFNRMRLVKDNRIKRRQDSGRSIASPFLSTGKVCKEQMMIYN